MSVYGYLICNRAREYLFLGKHLGDGFWRADWDDQVSDISILNFADAHREYPMSALLEHCVEQEFDDFDEVSQPTSRIRSEGALQCTICGVECVTALGKFLAAHLGHNLSYKVTRE